MTKHDQETKWLLKLKAFNTTLNHPVLNKAIFLADNGMTAHARYVIQMDSVKFDYTELVWLRANGYVKVW